jgi:hypothetical protein
MLKTRGSEVSRQADSDEFEHRNFNNFLPNLKAPQINFCLNSL